MTTDWIDKLSLANLSKLIHDRQVTPLEVVEVCLERIEKLNPTINAFITVLTDTAREEAEQAAAAIKRGEDWGPLHGIPIGVKDLIDVAGVPTTAGSRFFKDNIPRKDAIVIQQLRAAGAIIIGKTNLHEFAVGATNINPHYGPARNPWNPDLSPGGSSGGSAAAVAAAMCPGALGTDTGGSVRLPAAFCGLTGLRTALGQVSTQGVIPMSWSLDTVGPLAHSAEGVALMLDAMTIDAAVPHAQTIGEPVQGLHIGIPKDDSIWADLSLELVGPVRSAIDVLVVDAGMKLVEVSLPDFRQAYQAATTISMGDAAAYHRDRLANDPQLFGADVRARLEQGAARSAADYALARQFERSWIRRLHTLFRDEIDVLVTPATGVISHAIEGSEGVSAAAELLRFTYPFSLSRLPALSMPCGFSDDGLPVGVQLVGRDTSILLRAAHAHQQHTEWHVRRAVV
jgi:aspartyl-tRNA(Asn)/glutamyl-tRNA(Gln) amidotransferase subunit A